MKDTPGSPPYIVRVTTLTVCPPTDPLFSEECTHVSIRDEAGGEFLEVCQQSNDGEHQKIRVTEEEWPVLSEAVCALFREIRDAEDRCGGKT